METETEGDASASLPMLLVNTAFEYDTQKIVHIKNKKIGFLNRLLQLAIIGYIIGFAIVYKKGYQSMDDVVSSVTSKMKGVSYTNISDFPDLNISENETAPYNRIWDVSDYVIPPQQSDAFFVMTNMIITPNQRKGQCAEVADIDDTVDDIDDTVDEVKLQYLQSYGAGAYSLPSNHNEDYWHPRRDIIGGVGIPSVQGTGSRLKLMFQYRCLEL